MTHEYIDYKEKQFASRFPDDRPRLFIDRIPACKTKMEPGKQLTLGDLHGNAALLLFHLVKWGAADITAEQYRKLYQCIEHAVQRSWDGKYTVNAHCLSEFKEILSQIKFQSDFLLRIIGDETSDRGSNDYFTLLILQRLKECGVHVDILLSNHGLSFIHGYEARDFTPRYLHGSASSLINLKVLLDKEFIRQSEVEDLIETAYKPALKIITYSLNEEENRITIYSHAPIGMNTIQDLARKFEIMYRGETIQELIATIDAINKEFQIYVKEDAVHTLINETDLEAVAKFTHSKALELPERSLLARIRRFARSPVEICTWNRVYHPQIIERPETYNNYKLCFVHGHDSGESDRLTHVYCLDSEFAKERDFDIGYKALYSKESTRIPTDELERRAIASTLCATYAAGAAGAAGAECVTEITEEQSQPLIKVVLSAEPVETKLSETQTQDQVQEAVKREAVKNFILNHEKFQQLEEKLFAKAEKFTSTYYDTTKEEMRKAFLAAVNLKANILVARQNLQKGGSIEDFHKEYKEAIEAAMPILKTHRGWKQSLLNVLNCLVSLINCAISKKENKFKFFITPTDSEKKANALKENLPEMINEARLANP